MVKAVIDIGSNSIKMRIARVESGRVHVIRDETEVVRLGRGMSSTGLLSKESMILSCAAVSRMVRKASHCGAEIFIAGTMALRTARNASDFVNMVRESCGHEVHIFSGNDEARYSWLGAVDGLGLDGNAVMFDTGGGSTEFVAGTGGEMKRAVSVPVGAVNLSERFFPAVNEPVRKSACDEAISFVRNMLLDGGIDAFKSSEFQVIGVGGGVVAMAGVKNACENFVPSRLHGSILTQKDIVRQIRLYSSLTLKERENIIGLPKSRADVILGSACIVFAALRLLNAPSCIVSINGLRHGLLLGGV
ncbi:MAG: Ppx/GppA family phosphatase [Synergistaceae bacterium]|nr:Ppx/GppA family phosphatase [Synergistaceae bacterium]MBR0149725.1 Ppx/GppA family phosphatase [Synergistaceae bacterium]